MISVSGIDHVTIFTSKLAETRKFFAMFGLEPGPRPAVSIGGDWLYCGKSPIVHLAERSDAFEPKGAIDHFSLRVDDYDDMLARLDAAGIPYSSVEIPGGFGRQAFVHDPNGVKVELTWRP